MVSILPVPLYLKKKKKMSIIFAQNYIISSITNQYN